MGCNEEGTLVQLKSIRRALVDPAIAAHRGRIVKTTGDGMLVEFASAVDAVRVRIRIGPIVPAPRTWNVRRRTAGTGCLERTSLVAVADVSPRGCLPQSLLKIVRYGPNEVKIAPKSRRWCLLS